MRNKIGKCLMVVGAALILAALSLLLYNRWQAAQADTAAQELLPAVQQAIEEPASSAAASTKMPVREIDGESYIGYLSIPALSLELPVLSDWDYQKLKTAPCRYYGSLDTDDLVLCGHNYDRHFGRLKNLQSGDTVTFTAMDGTVYTYRVAVVEIVQPTDIEYMTQSGYPLTLYTCTYGGQTRVAVRCSYVGTNKATNDAGNR